MFNKQNLPVTVAGTGFVVLIFGIFMAWYGFPKITDMKIKEGVSMEKGSESYNMWEVTPFPLKFKIYIFNVQNPEEVQQGETPIVREIGPYVYDQYRKKEKVVINEETDTITYVLKKTYFFNEKESGCRSDEDTVTVLNAALVGTALTVYGMFPSALGTVSDAVPHLFPGIKDIFLRVKVKDLLFNGVLLDCSSPDIEFVCTAMKGTAPETVRQADNKRDFMFSMFHHLNNTEEGPYTIGRGMKNTSRGEIYAYKGSPMMEGMWKGATCNMVNGTDSTIFPSYEKPPARVYVFSSDLCRSVYIDYEKETTTMDIPTYRFSTPASVLDISEENDCFCPREKDASYKEFIACPPKGTMNLMPCMMAPTIYSNPHFYLADRKLLNFVSGLKPEKEKHESYAEIEPLTGTPVSGRKRAQFNLNIKKFDDFYMLNNVTDGLMPLLWLEEGADLTPELAQKLKDAYKALSLVDVFKYVIIVTGVILIAISAVLFFQKEKLWCFADTRVDNFNGPVRVSTITRNNDNKSAISNFDNNSAIMYPNLYPQLVNRNVNVVNKKLMEDRFLV